MDETTCSNYLELNVVAAWARQHVPGNLALASVTLQALNHEGCYLFCLFYGCCLCLFALNWFFRIVLCLFWLRVTFVLCGKKNVVWFTFVLRLFHWNNTPFVRSLAFPCWHNQQGGFADLGCDWGIVAESLVCNKSFLDLEDCHPDLRPWTNYQQQVSSGC